MSEAVELEPCGGCGETNPDKRCLGCLHPFRAKPEGEPVATDAEFFDAVVGWLSARDMIDRQDALDGLTVAEVIAALDEHENGMATARPRPVACPDREAVARIIDPHAWATCDKWAAGALERDQHPSQLIRDRLGSAATEPSRQRLVGQSLAKADAVLALLSGGAE